jgi:hypothetical protein
MANLALKSRDDRPELQLLLHSDSRVRMHAENTGKGNLSIWNTTWNTTWNATQNFTAVWGCASRGHSESWQHFSLLAGSAPFFFDRTMN